MKGRQIRYSAAELAFIRQRRTMKRSKLHEKFVREFGRDDVSEIHIKALCKRKGWMTGRTGCFEKGLVPHNKGKPHPAARSPNAVRNQFKKGHQPHNTNYLGHERLSKEGYIEVSIDEMNPHTGFERRYVLKHRWVWEKINGPVPEGMVLKCKGDKTNTDPSNWDLIPRALLPRLNGRFGRDYDEAPAELKPSILAVVKLEHQLRERGSRS